MDHSRVARELCRQRCSDGSPEIRLAGPVRAAIDSSTIAENHGRVHSLGSVLQLALYVEDRALGGLGCIAAGTPRKSSAKNDSRRLGQDHHMLAERLLDELQNSGLPRAGPARENDSPHAVRVGASTRRAILIEFHWRTNLSAHCLELGRW